ncbi:sialate O-acetylesterase [Gramella sp. KN1008]|uniref:sialate O-acetylesterase n=1 Tax=Gramella sp. KN1008 TaxID=2529298 RepID=UPI00103ECFFD|nr:sialate O-acetylesterase [Gramella sp. KN1008]TBW28036.1 hypothetical protein EZJ28_09915 [Gramella sp. KN1008]
MRILIFTLLLFSVMSSYPQANEIESCGNQKKVFLFAGQSNMDGRGNGEELSKKDLERLTKVADRILFYYNKKPVTPLQLTTPGKFVQNKFNLNQSFGPELFFGIELAEKYPEDQFIFIKRSEGGTSLYGCWNPEWTYEKASLINEENKAKLYSDFISYTESILQSYKPEEYEIKGMFWVQGEHDSYTDRWGEEPAASYGKNLKNLIENVRIDLNALEMPFIIFQVGKGKVVEGMLSTAKNDDRVFLIPQSQDKSSPNYYEQYPQPIGHYNTGSMKRIGVEFFKIYDSNFINK